jgi:hypothetical protein
VRRKAFQIAGFVAAIVDGLSIAFRVSEVGLWEWRLVYRFESFGLSSQLVAGSLPS